MAEWKVKERHADGCFQMVGTYRNESDAREALHNAAKLCDRTHVQCYELVRVRGETEQSVTQVRVLHGAECSKIEGDLEVTGSLALHGMVTGNIRVLEGGKLELYGMCGGNLLIEEHAAASVFGTVDGDAENRGGRLAIFGVINGRLCDASGDTKVAPGAVVKGGIVNPARPSVPPSM